MDLLKSLNCVVTRPDGQQVTKAGLISFGKSQALRRLDPSIRIDYIRVPGRSWVPDADALLEAIEMRGPTIRVVGRVISTILDDIPKAVTFVEGNPKRTDVALIPERVIREAVVNAIAHRSYQAHQPIQILRYSNRIEIRNPGYSLKSQDRFDEPGSALRNPHIAEILHETRFAETKGSGIRVMRQKMRESGLTEPTFISSREEDKFQAIFLFHHFLSEDDWVWLAQFKDFGLDNDQLKSLIYLREMGAVDNACYRNINQVDTFAASTSLRKLKEIGLVESRGGGSRTYYVPGPQFLAIDRRAAPVPASASTRPGTGAPAAMPRTLAVQLAKLGKRIQPAEIESLIVEICKWQPSSAEEIANFLGKTRNYVTNKHLRHMVADGRLAYTIPQMVKHPGQKYTVTAG